MVSGYFLMLDLSQKNILICSNLKSERVILFNFFDKYEAEMIHTATDIQQFAELLDTEDIDIFVVECSKELIQSPDQLEIITKKHPKVKKIIVLNKNLKVTDEQEKKIESLGDVKLNHPFTEDQIEKTLIELCEGKVVKKQNLKPVKKETTTSIINVKQESNDLWSVFFRDSIQSMLVVDASTLKIMHANDSLCTLFGFKKVQLIGKGWEIFDDSANKDNYDEYIKEINSKEKTSFTLTFKKNKQPEMYLFEYHLSFLDGNIVYIGTVTKKTTEGMSDDFYQLTSEIFDMNLWSEKAHKVLEKIKVNLNLDFLLISEINKSKLVNPLIVGKKEKAIKLLRHAYTKQLYPKILELNEYKYTVNKNTVDDFNDVLSFNGLTSLCIKPIFHESNLYGVILGGSQVEITNWASVSFLFNLLASNSKFSIFQRKILNQREKEGQTDQLTGLPNRNSMMNKFADILKNGVDSEKYLSLMIVDIEKLNYLNKNIGIELTDEIIISVAELLMQPISNEGKVYKLSRDEFVVLLNPHLDKNLVKNKVEQIMQLLNRPILLSNGEELQLNYNIGISIFPDDGQTVSSMMKNADLAMYDAKLAGKNNYVIFKYSETGKALKQKSQMQENLIIAIKKNHIKVFFQPKIDALTEDIIGFEALVRWIDPDEGMINPGLFIPLSEETGLINEIGAIVAKRSCEKLVEWQRKFGLKLSCSINLSIVQLINKNLPKELGKIIDDSGVHPHFIDFEITETMSLDEVPNLVESLNEIVGLGCTLSIDDFGTGHSSLDYVKKIPANYIKIDQSFVKNIGLNPEDEAILDATVNIAKRLNRKIIAEGVETEAQREYLLEREVEYFQGFLFSRPMSEEDVELLLAQRVKLMGSN